MKPRALGLSIIALASMVSCNEAEPVASSDASLRERARPPGHWYVARDPKPRTTAEGSDPLAGLGYAPGSEEARESVGVLHAEPERMQPGVNLYSSGHSPDAFLMASDGEVLHRWRIDPTALWPDHELEFGFLRKARLLSGERLFAVFSDRGLAAVDWDSNVLWTYDGHVHHDVCELADGTIVVLDRARRVTPEFHESRVLVDDRLTLLTPTGEVVARISLLDCMLRSDFADRTRELVAESIRFGLEAERVARETWKDELEANPELADRVDAVADFFHSNSVRVVGRDFAARNDDYEEGWLVVSIRNIDALVVIELDADRRSGAARHLLEGAWRKQHEAIPLAKGTILLFDNRGSIRKNGRERARVVEIDPTTGEVLWSVGSADRRPFLSPIAGSCQRLANGNTIVVESTGGTAYEMTPDGECVWKFVSPHRAGDSDQLVALLPDMIRLDRDVVADRLDPR